jgi:hypothetical protein
MSLRVEVEGEDKRILIEKLLLVLSIPLGDV